MATVSAFNAPTSSKPPPPARPLRKKKRKTLYIVLGVVVFVGAVVAAAVKARRAPAGTAVTTEKTVVKTITQLVSATGKIQPEVEVKIAPEVTGEIIEMPFREGAVVKKGDLLVSVKPDTYRFAVDQREADLASARASNLDSKIRLMKAEEDFHRSEEVYQKNLISASDLTASKTIFEAAQASFESSLASIRRAEGALSQARDQLAKTIIYAPMDGTVSSRTSEVGERVAGTGNFNAAEVMRIADLSSMEVRINVNENDIVNVKVGDKARISIDAYPGRRFAGEVKEIAAAARTTGQMTQEEVTNFQVKIRITDKDVALRPGMSANADIETRTVENVVAVPTQSVTVRTRDANKTLEQLAADRSKTQQETKGAGAATVVNERQRREQERAERGALQRVVFVIEGDHVKMVVVETGIADTTHTEIKSGLSDGDEVVTGSFSVITRTLKDGMKVRVDKPKKPAEKTP